MASVLETSFAMIATPFSTFPFLLLLLAAMSAILSSSFVIDMPAVPATSGRRRQLLQGLTTKQHRHSLPSSCDALYNNNMSTVIKPPETETQRRRNKNRDENLGIPPDGDNSSIRGPMEWLVDDPLISREYDDPFHILLLDATFTQNSRITIPYVASSCAYVLSMPYDEAAELAAHAEKEGFSCLGTWSHEECVRYGRQLQNRDVICRVVPFCEGGDRAWQARNAREDDQVVGGGSGSGDDARWA